jgi:hypothetical protein
LQFGFLYIFHELGRDALLLLVHFIDGVQHCLAKVFALLLAVKYHDHHRVLFNHIFDLLYLLEVSIGHDRDHAIELIEWLWFLTLEDFKQLLAPFVLVEERVFVFEFLLQALRRLGLYWFKRNQ